MNRRYTSSLLVIISIVVLLLPQATWALCDGENYNSDGAWNSMFSTKDNKNVVAIDPKDPRCMPPNLLPPDPKSPCPVMLAGSKPSAVGCQPSGYNSTLKFFITGAVCQVQEALSDSAFRVYCPIQFHMKKTLYAMATIYIALYSMALLLRMSTLREGWSKMVKLTIVLAVAGNPDTFYEVVYQMAFNALNGFSELLMRQLPPRDLAGRLVYSCPTGVPNKGPVIDPACTVIQDCVDINIIHSKFVDAADPGKPDPKNFGKWLVPDPADTSGDTKLRALGAPKASDSKGPDLSTKVPPGPNYSNREAPLGWMISPGVDKPCLGGAQQQDNCILQCGTVGPAIFEPNLIQTTIELACGGKNKVATCDPKTIKEITDDFTCAGVAEGQPRCWAVPRVTVPNRSVFEAYDALFDEFIGNDFQNSIVAYIIATILSFFGIGVLIGVLTFFGVTAVFWAFIRMFISFLTAIISLTFILMFAPIFIPMVLFKVTQPLFKRWVVAVINYTLQPVLVLAFLLLTADMLSLTDLGKGLGTRGVHIVMDEWNLTGDIKGLSDYLNLDVKFRGPKFSIEKKNENKNAPKGNCASIPFTTNIKKQPYFDYALRMAVHEAGCVYTTTNLQQFLGLFQFGEQAMAGMGLYTCTPSDCDGVDPKFKKCDPAGCFGGSPATKENTCACASTPGAPVDCCKMLWKGTWSGWMGICSAEAFLNNPDAQMILGVRFAVTAGVPMARNFPSRIGTIMYDAIGTALPKKDNKRAVPHVCTGLNAGMVGPIVTLAGITAGSNGFGSGDLSDLSKGGVAKLMTNSSPFTIKYRNRSDECAKTSETGGECDCANSSQTGFCEDTSKVTACVSGGNPGDKGCGPYGEPGAVALIMPLDQDGSANPLDARDLLCDFADISDGIGEPKNEADIYKKLTTLDGEPVTGPFPNPVGVCPAAGQPYTAPPPSGRTDIAVPEGNPESLRRIYAAVVAFTLAWMLVGKITSAFQRKLPQITQELATWSGSRTAPIIVGQSGALDSITGSGGSGSNPAKPFTGSGEGRASFYTLEGAAGSLFSNIAGVARGRTSRPNQMGYTLDGKKATKSSGGSYKRPGWNQFSLGQFLGMGPGGGSVVGLVSRKGGTRLRKMFGGGGKGFDSHMNAKTQNASVLRRTGSIAEHANFRQALGGNSPWSGGGSRSGSHGGGNTPWGAGGDSKAGGNSPWSGGGSISSFIKNALGATTAGAAVTGLTALGAARKAMTTGNSPWGGSEEAKAGGGNSPWGADKGDAPKSGDNSPWSGGSTELASLRAVFSPEPAMLQQGLGMLGGSSKAKGIIDDLDKTLKGDTGSMFRAFSNINPGAAGLSYLASVFGGGDRAGQKSESNAPWGGKEETTTLRASMFTPAAEQKSDAAPSMFPQDPAKKNDAAPSMFTGPGGVVENLSNALKGDKDALFTALAVMNPTAVAAVAYLGSAFGIGQSGSSSGTGSSSTQTGHSPWGADKTISNAAWGPENKGGHHAPWGPDSGRSHSAWGEDKGDAPKTEGGNSPWGGDKGGSGNSPWGGDKGDASKSGGGNSPWDTAQADKKSDKDKDKDPA